MVFQMAFGNIKSFTYCFIRAKEGFIEDFSENNWGIVADLIAFFNANYVFGTCLMKNLPGKLWITAGHKNKLRFTALRLDHVFQALSWQKVRLTLFILNDKISIEWSLCPSNTLSKLFFLESMTREMKSNRIFCECLRQIVQRSLYLLVLDKLACALKALENPIEFFVMIDLIYFIEFVLFGIIDHKGWSKKEREMYISIGYLSLRQYF